MKIAKKLILVGALVVGAWVATETRPAAAADPCAGVRCMECPEGYHWAPTPKNCCRCLPD